MRERSFFGLTSEANRVSKEKNPLPRWRFRLGNRDYTFEDEINPSNCLQGGITRTPEGTFATITHFFLEEKFRTLGISKQMLAGLEAKLKRKGVDFVIARHCGYQVLDPQLLHPRVAKLLALEDDVLITSESEYRALRDGLLHDPYAISGRYVLLVKDI